MKKLSFITSALVALAMLSSCQKELVSDIPASGVTRFTATILQTKTDIASDGKVTWCEGDEITVTDASKNTAAL